MAAGGLPAEKAVHCLPMYRRNPCATCISSQTPSRVAFSFGPFSGLVIFLLAKACIRWNGFGFAGRKKDRLHTGNIQYIPLGVGVLPEAAAAELDTYIAGRYRILCPSAIPPVAVGGFPGAFSTRLPPKPSFALPSTLPWQMDPRRILVWRLDAVLYVDSGNPAGPHLISERITMRQK